MEAIRVDAKYLQQFPGRTVKVIGKLTNLDPAAEHGVVEANGPINVKFQSQDSQLAEGRYYELVATVDSSDSSLKVIETTDMGDALNDRALAKMVELAHRFPDLFYQS